MDCKMKGQQKIGQFVGSMKKTQFCKLQSQLSDHDFKRSSVFFIRSKLIILNFTISYATSYLVKHLKVQMRNLVQSKLQSFLTLKNT